MSAAPALPAFPVVVALLVAIRTLTNVRLGLYSRRWGYASVPDLVRIVCAIVLGSIFSALVFYSAATLLHGSSLDSFPRSFWVIEALVAVAILGGVRFAIRAASDLPAAAAAATTDGLPTLLYGAGRTGVMLARSAQRNPGAGVRPVGFLDDDPSLREEVVGGLRVFGGLAELPDAVARDGRTGAPDHDARRPWQHHPAGRGRGPPAAASRSAPSPR